MHHFLLILSENSSKVPMAFSPSPGLFCSAVEVLQYRSHEGLVTWSLPVLGDPRPLLQSATLSLLEHLDVPKTLGSVLVLEKGLSQC